jgi:hypothetical protein
MAVIWDGENYSCAYDALYTILYNIWVADPASWNRRFKNIKNTFINSMCLKFKRFLDGETSLEDVRDSFRKRLHQKDKNLFPYGTTDTSISSLAMDILSSKEFVSFSYSMYMFSVWL